MIDRRLDRRVYFDGRSKDYNIRTLIGAVTPRSYTWAVPGGSAQVLDQGREGACVGFAWAAERAAKPVPYATSNSDALDVYRHAQRLDDWPGEAPAYSGTSVLAGAKAAQARGWLGSYRWAFGIDDALAAISRHGPCVLGIPWHASMYEPTPRPWLPGRVRATITVAGPVVGGHAILARGVSMSRREVTLRNSWSPQWGDGGDACISFADLDTLLRNDGECCVPVVR